MDVTQAIEKAVETKGSNYVYERPRRKGGFLCAYEDKGKPSCIVGHVLYALGVPVESLKELDKGDDATFFVLASCGVIDDLLMKAGADPLSHEEVVGLSGAQQLQDEGCTWDLALQAYYSAVKEV